MKRPINILLVANTAWSIFNFRKGLICQLIERGVTVTVLAPHDDSSSMLSSLGCNVIDLGMSPHGINPLDDLFLLSRLWIHYKKIKPSFIIHYTIKPNIYGTFVAHLLNIKSMSVITGLGQTFIKGGWLKKLIKLLYRFSFKYPCQIWFLNEEDNRIFVDEKLVLPEKAKVVDGEGVDIELFYPMTLARENFTFLLVARMICDKGIYEFANAAQLVKTKYPTAKFKMLGGYDSTNPDAINKKDMEQWQQQGLIEYLGSTHDVRNELALADCIVLPSYREGLSRTLIEAAAMAKPLVTTAVAGCRDVVIDGQTGFLCQPGDAQSLAQACIYMLKLSENERLAMGLAGRALMVNRFDEKIVIKKYMDTLTELGVLGAS